MPKRVPAVPLRVEALNAFSFIEKVFDELGEWPPYLYAVHQHGIEWKGVTPSTAVLIEYRYCAFEFQDPFDLPASKIGVPTSRYNSSTSASFVPSTGALRLLQPGEDVLD